MPGPICHPDESGGYRLRSALAEAEPRALRTFTPTLAVLSQSAGVYHWTPEGKRLFDFTSGVLVSNLGHNPTGWLKRFAQCMAWPADGFESAVTVAGDVPEGFTPALAMTAYNAITPIEVDATRRLLDLLVHSPGGGRMQKVMWAASGSEAIQKALWTAAAFDKTRPMILATRFGFHGKKGLSNAVTGCETDAERDPRVKFISFPMAECRDVSMRNATFDPAPYRKELDALLHQFGRKIGTLITEPYLGGGGSYHPPKAYLQLLESFCRANDIVFILDEVQANFGRTGSMFAFTTYGIEPDIVVLGKGLGNGVPVAAAVGRADLFNALDYGEGSDTWSANPISCAAVLATLDEFAAIDVIAEMKEASSVIENGLVKLKQHPIVANVRGESGGMVWGVEMADHGGKSAAEWANAFILGCYLGDGARGDGVHLLGPLAKKVVRVAPPLIITPTQATTALGIMHNAARRLAAK